MKEYHETVEYVYWNPVRRGLVMSTSEWPWSSCPDYAGPEGESLRRQQILRIDRVGLPADEKARV